MDFNAILINVLPYVLVGIGLALSVVLSIYLLFQRLTEKRKASRLNSLKSRWRESREEFIESRREEVTDAVNRVLDMLRVDVVLLGNTLWRSPGFHHHLKTIADICLGAGTPLRIPKEQFDRMFDNGEEGGHGRHGSGAESILRILEELQREGLFELESTTEVSISQDPEVSMGELWEHFKSEGRNVLVITSDRKLRIQIRNDIQREQRLKCRLVEPQEIRELLSRCSGAVHLAFGTPAPASDSLSEQSAGGRSAAENGKLEQAATAFSRAM